MLIVINMTGMSRTYWLPFVVGRFRDRRLWYAGFTWLQFEVTVFGPDMGKATVGMLNGGFRQHAPACDPSEGEVG